MDKFIELKFQGKADQFFLVSYHIFNANSQLLERGESSLPPCPELVANIRNWRKTYRADVTHPRLEILQESITNSSDINHEELIRNLKKNLNEWLNSPDFLPLKESLIARLSRDEVVLVGIDINDPDLKYAPWHLWNFFEYFPKADFALLRPKHKEGNNDLHSKQKRDRSNINIMAIIGDSRGINTTEDTTILQSLPHVNHPQILSEPSHDQVVEALHSTKPMDILFFAGHGKEEDHKGKICINNNDSLSIEEIKGGLEKRIEEGLQLAIFNSCDGLELGEAISDLHIPQAIVMKEAVPDVIAQRFLKDFLAEFSQGVSLVQALRQTRNKLKKQEHDYPYASWLPVLYCNPTEPLMQWSHPQPPFLQKYLWQAKIAASCLLGLMAILGGMVLAHKVSSAVNLPLVHSSEIKTTKVYEEKSYGIKLEYPSNWVLQEKLDSITGNIITLFPADKPEVELTLNIQDLSGRSLTLDQFKEKIVVDLQKYSENFTLMQIKNTALDYKPGYKLTYTTTRQGIKYQAVDIFAQKGNKSYMFTYITPASEKFLFVDYQSQAQKIVDSLVIVN